MFCRMKWIILLWSLLNNKDSRRKESLEKRKEENWERIRRIIGRKGSAKLYRNVNSYHLPSLELHITVFMLYILTDYAN
jgi:hypothetical protein